VKVAILPPRLLLTMVLAFAATRGLVFAFGKENRALPLRSSHMWLLQQSFAYDFSSALQHACVLLCMHVRLSCRVAGILGYLICTPLSCLFPRFELKTPAPHQTDMPASMPFVLCHSRRQDRDSQKAARGSRVIMRLSASDQDVVDGDVDCGRRRYVSSLYQRGEILLRLLRSRTLLSKLL